jgi:adenine-specific DNA-methyltransferase
MVEFGEHCHTHIIPRLKKLIDGQDPGGITETVCWKGGGGYRYYHLAPSLLNKDRWGNWIISKTYNPAMLAEAVCKLMGFIYAPSEAEYWMHGRSCERDFIYVTTQSLTDSQLRAISEDVGDDRTLLICCKAFRADPNAFPNLSVRKIPQAVLRKCEWSRDDYSLNITKLPPAQPVDDGPPSAPQASGRKARAPQPDLFTAGPK